MSQEIFSKIIASLPDGNVQHVCVGLHWTAVVVENQGELVCGLASTLKAGHHHGTPDVPQAGTLENMNALALTALTQAKQPTLVSIGLATVNALLLRRPDSWVDLNAEDVIASHAAEKSVALIGHFPFTERLRTRVGHLTVLELNPLLSDLPVSEAERALPEAQVVAITGMTLLNHTLVGLLDLCDPDALVILLGPSVPLSSFLFDRGVDILCGSIVTSIDQVLATVRQGGTFRQVHRAGVRLVTVTKPGYAL